METYKKALSIRQPWAWLIANGYKGIENRSWNTTYRGEFFIHAAKAMTKKEYQQCQEFMDLVDKERNILLPRIYDLEFGGIIGAATLTACVTESDSGWFTGKYGFVLEEARVLPLMPCTGKLGFFYPSY
ncbi:ASCH domain-containing protein [Pseudanabaena biceps]|nr:ASCH domain-containing protein [Pseudanabaena biceps]NUN66342.1 ASCH domain-containing protein [Pseudanabaena biceps]